MGVILGYMRLFGANNIGFEPAEMPKDPKRVSAGRKGGKMPKKARGRTAGRHPVKVAARDALAKIKGPDFTWGSFMKELAAQGWNRKPTAQRAINSLIAEKLVKRKARGVYAKLPALVKNAA
jgi:hypothetical protein